MQGSGFVVNANDCFPGTKSARIWLLCRSVYVPGGKQRVVLPLILGLNREATFALLATKTLWTTMDVSFEHDNYQDYMVRNLLPDVYERQRLHKRVARQIAP